MCRRARARAFRRACAKKVCDCARVLVWLECVCVCAHYTAGMWLCAGDGAACNIILTTKCWYASIKYIAAWRTDSIMQRTDKPSKTHQKQLKRARASRARAVATAANTPRSHTQTLTHKNKPKPRAHRRHCTQIQLNCRLSSV